jgi:hypothetical protein
MNSKKGIIQPDYNRIRFMVPFLFFVFVFLYIWLKINPALINQYQDTLFLFDRAFFHSFLQYPGGLAEYVSAFLSQFMIISWLGALIIAILCVLLYDLTFRIVKLLFNSSNRILPFIPVLMVLTLHSCYSHPLSVNLGLLLTLLFFILFIKFRSEKTTKRFVLFFIMAGLLYWFAAGHLLFFAGLMILYELLQASETWKKRILSVLYYFLMAVLIPYLCLQLFFMISLPQAYLYLLPLHTIYKPAVIPFLLYGFFPFLIVIASARRKIEVPEKWRRIGTLIQAGIILLLIGILALVSFDKKTNTFLRMDRFSGLKKWPKIIEMARKTDMNDLWITYFTNRALYHTGRLSSEMFSFPQIWGLDGLFLTEEYSYSRSMLKSDLLFELGYINESQHIAHEGLSQEGEKPRILRRLAIINLLKGEKQAAMMFLSKLEKTLFYKKWARAFMKMARNESLLQNNAQLRYIRTVMPDSDFILVPKNPLLNLSHLLTNKNRNHMAFEYLMAGYLLEGDLDSFMNHIRQINDFNYPAIPRHFEEAIITYMMDKGKDQVDLPGREPNVKTVDSYETLLSIMMRHHGRKEEARDDLAKNHKDTYWYYLLYTKIPEAGE